MASNSSKIVPVLLSGGTGSRLWPKSRELYPKQLLAFASEQTLVQEAVLRMAEGERFAAPLIVCNEDQRFIIAEQIRAIGAAPAGIIIEPMGRNTAPAAAVAALQIAKTDPDALMLLAPADHLITDRDAFLAAVDRGLPAARAGKLVTFGMSPSHPETGYGYIKRGAETDNKGVFTVAAFVEKPNRATAQSYLEVGDYSWNSGIFLFPVKAYLAELAQYAPAILTAAKESVESAKGDLDFIRLDKAAFATAPSISIDYAVMEKTAEAVVVPAQMGWTDIGSWAALWEVAEKDSDGNVCLGDVVMQGSHNCYVDGSDRLTAIVGLDDVVVVTTSDAVLVVSKDHAQDVRQIVDHLKKENRKEHIAHRKVFRPWGFYDSVHTGHHFQVKHIQVAPGGRLSLQKHAHRAEHWVVVGGEAVVTRDNEKLTLRPNQSVHIPLGAVHRLENFGTVPLDLIEVQCGDYLGEDDIVRLEDTYNRS